MYSGVSGNVGIGTSAPISDLHIVQSGGSSTAQQTGGINLENGIYHWRIYNSNNYFRYNYSTDGINYTPLAYVSPTDGSWNQLSDKSYEELDALGLPKDLVDGYIAGQKALADNDVSEVQKVVGGQDNYAQLLDWSSKNLNQAEKDAFNDTIDNGSTEQVKIAVQGLMSRAGMSPDNAQQNLFEGDVNVTNTDTFGSVAQVTDAMNDPRYSKDPAYRKEVEEKLARSSVI